MAPSNRQARVRGGDPASTGALRSLLGSTALHGALLGLGCLLGAGAAVRAAEGSRAPRELTAVFRAPAPTFVVEEPAELAEAVPAEESLPEPELVPVEPESMPEFAAEPVFAPVAERGVERSDFTSTLDFAPRLADPAAENVEVPLEAPAKPLAPRPESVPAPAVVAPPIPRDAPDPDYPRLALRRGEEGTVLCRLSIDALGRVTNVEIEESSGSERLDEAAREKLATWTFTPGTLDGVASPSEYRHRVRFELGGRAR